MNQPVSAIRGFLPMLAVLISGIGPRQSAAEIPSFRYDVLPVLTQSGCNAGTCHGTPTGKNGFRLSLRGFAPELDYTTLTREFDSRRINRLNPDQSLLLQKATAQVPHEGGRRIRKADQAYRILRDWIDAGTPDDPADISHLQRLTIDPQNSTVDAPKDHQEFRVTAFFQDGSQEDVTDRCRFSMTDDTIAAWETAGVLKKQTRGEVTISSEFAGSLASATVLFREPVPDFSWPDPPSANRIDELVFARLKHLQIEPAKLCTDETFLRRVYLDVMGTLPTR